MNFWLLYFMHKLLYFLLNLLNIQLLFPNIDHSFYFNNLLTLFKLVEFNSASKLVFEKFESFSHKGVSSVNQYWKIIWIL